MKINQIMKIKKHKSFSFFENQSNNLFDDKLNIFFGENGNGKSSIVDIFKNLSQNKDFEKAPNKIKLEIDEETYTFENNEWNKKLNKKDFIFFDDDFITENIHNNKRRENWSFEPGQKSAKLFISVDKDAIELKNLEDKEKTIWEYSKKELKSFENNNKDLLDKEYLIFKDFYNKFQNKTSNEIKNIKVINEDKINEISEKISEKNKNKEIVDNIQKINEINFKEKSINISENNYLDFTNVNLEENSKIEAKKELIDYISNNKDFFETGFNIRKEEDCKKCPFCLSNTQEENIMKILDLKNKVFDKTYKENLRKFKELKEKIIFNLNQILNENFDFLKYFNELEKLNKDFKIQGLYILEEKNKYNPKLNLNETRVFLNKILEIEPDNRKYRTISFDGFKKEINCINEEFEKFKTLIKEKNKIIAKFKKENDNKTLKETLKILYDDLEELESKKNFFDNFEQIKKYYFIKESVMKKEKDLEKKKEIYDKSKENYKSYCSSKLFKNKISDMKEYLQKFNLNFKLEFQEVKGNHETIPFVFIVKDKEGNERTLKEGISNGELQALSISFFFAFLKSQDLENKVIFFDDPITSLDNSYIHNFINIFSEELLKFNQTFIFTHHLTFFKFLTKKFKKDSKNMIILKNREDRGGSFYCNYEDSGYFKKLEEFDEKGLEEIRKHNIIAYEEKIITYGQMLRYEVESFIKNEILQWNNSSNFSSILSGLKTREIDDEDVETIKRIYNFCNWTTSHVDKEENCFFNMLKEEIKKFIDIKRKILNLPSSANSTIKSKNIQSLTTT